MSAAPVRQPEPSGLHVVIRPMRRWDLRAVMRIEQLVYPRGWSRSVFLGELRATQTRTYVTAKVDRTLVGYGGVLYGVDEAHITNVAVDPDWQRHGIGTRLLATLARAGIARGRSALTLEVRVSNKGAQELYRQFGFVPAGIRRGYYTDTNEDAIVMWAHDITSPEYAARLEALEARIPGTVTVEGVWDR